MHWLAQARYGFFAVRGFFGVVLGLIILMVLLWGIWTIFDILAGKFSNANTSWMFQVVKVVLIVVSVIWFINAVFGLFPW
jgi:cell division protein FtsX